LVRSMSEPVHLAACMPLGFARHTTVLRTVVCPSLSTSPPACGSDSLGIQQSSGLLYVRAHPISLGAVWGGLVIGAEGLENIAGNARNTGVLQVEMREAHTAQLKHEILRNRAQGV